MIGCAVFLILGYSLYEIYSVLWEIYGDNCMITENVRPTLGENPSCNI